MREIYLDNSATTPLCADAMRVMTEAMELYGNPSSLHTQGERAHALLERARREVAATLGVRGNPEADTIDVYEALDMFLPGLFAYRSILAGGIPMEVPNLRNKEEREIWRHDTTCTDPKAAGDMLIPTLSSGTPDIPQAVYDRQAQLWAEECAKTEGTYRTAALSQGSKQ